MGESEFNQNNELETINIFEYIQIVTQLKQYKHTMASSPDLLFKCKSRLEKSLHKLVSMRKCIGALMAVWYLTNNALSIVRYENLSSVVRTMNQLLPMVHGMGLKEFENASIQLFLIYDDAATRCCALEDTIELVGRGSTARNRQQFLTQYSLPPRMPDEFAHSN